MKSHIKIIVVLMWFYPVQYEGMEPSANILSIGSAPNQQIVFGACRAMRKFGQVLVSGIPHRPNSLV